MDDDKVEFVGWSMAEQIAIDKNDNIWRVGGWHDLDDDDLAMVPYSDPDFDTQWEAVEFVSLYLDTPEGRVWATIDPDDFGKPTEG